MASLQLHNYLRANRKRLALSQEEVAYLLGTRRGATVCRNERFVQDPTLETALAYEALFQRPVGELFAGLYHEIEARVAARAKVLAQRADRLKPNKRSARKRQTFMAIVTAQSRNH